MRLPGESIMRSLTKGARTFWDVVGEQTSQHRRMNGALRTLIESGLVESDGRGVLRLTAKGWALSKDVPLRPADRGCPACLGRGVVAGQDLFALQERFRRLAAGRPAITTEYDQGVVPPEVAFARVALLDQRGDLAGKDILILGDDDLMCVAFALTGLARRITVLEVDRRITSFLRELVDAEGWNAVEIVDYDARGALPEALRSEFDVFFTDPVETVGGIALFISRCAESLRGEGSTGYFGLTHIESGWAKWLGVERAVLEMNLAIAEVIKDFNSYLFIGDEVLRNGMKIVGECPIKLSAPDRLWFTSTIFRLQAVGKPRPAFAGPVDLGRELYVDEDTI